MSFYDLPKLYIFIESICLFKKIVLKQLKERLKNTIPIKKKRGAKKVKYKSKVKIN